MEVTQGKTFDFLMGRLRQCFAAFPDERRGKNISYTMEDAASSAFSVFFTQEPSFLSYQRRMEEKHAISNEQTIFAVAATPSDSQIRRLLDSVPAKVLNGVFWESVDYLEQNGQLESFRTNVGDQDLLVVLDGTWYFTSQEIHCNNCLTKIHDKETTYYHAMINPVIVMPGKSQVIPLPPEFIRNSDGGEKQDCEQNGAKRWIKNYGHQLSMMKTTIMGDDLYAHEPICKELLKSGLNFILVCKEESHKTLYEWIKGICEEVRVEKVIGVKKVKKETWVYRFVNNIPIREQKGKNDNVLLVNFCEITILDEEGKKKYHNAFITNFTITVDNVEEVAKCGRGRWKTENENNNTLKTKGYHLEHNFGHGKKHLASVLATLNILGFAFHTVLEIVDKSYQTLRETLGRRDTLFHDMRAYLKKFCFKSFNSLMAFMLGHKEIAVDHHIPVPI